MLQSPYWPFAILLISIFAVVFMISFLRFHPFIALMLAAMIVGILSVNIPLMEGVQHLVKAVELPMVELGSTAGKIAWVIALAAIIGTAMLESGSAEKIVDVIIAVLGEKRASLALLISGFILSIPVFFDTVFFLLIPLAIALAIRTKQNYLLYVLAIGGGAVITHSLVPPTPGPLIMAETLQIDLGITIMSGLAAGILPALVVLYLAARMNRTLNIPLRLTDAGTRTIENAPSLFESLMPILLPIVLISLASIVNVIKGSTPESIAFLGNKNVAMGLGTAFALWVWAKQKEFSGKELWEASARPLEIAGVIILITSAGGAFGAMLRHSGIGEAIEQLTGQMDINYILLAWFIAAVMKTAQGSSTVAMITTSSIMFALIGTGVDLPYHPVYILLAIGFGSLFVVWMNDSGFWVVSRMSGLTEKEALQTFSVTVAAVALTGLVEVLVMSYIMPFAYS